MNVLSEQELNDFFEENFIPERHSVAFRAEFLSEYDVGTDGSDFHRYAAGELEPTWDRKRDVLKAIQTETDAGLVTERVKVIAAPVTLYDRYACEWGYDLNRTVGERIRIWDLAERALPQLEVTQDFWLLGDTAVLLMHYDEVGRFEGASLPDDPAPYVRTRDALWAGAVAFEDWYPAHPELRQARRAA